MPKNKTLENNSTPLEGINIKPELSSASEDGNPIPEHEGDDQANSVENSIENNGAQDIVSDEFEIESPSEPTKQKTKKKKNAWVPKRQYQCLTCFHRSNRRSNMTDHLKIHKSPTDLQWFTCTICDYKAKHKRSVNRHQQRVHKLNQNITYSESETHDNESKADGADGTKLKQEPTEVLPEFVVYQEHCTLEQLDAEPEDRRLTGKFDCSQVGYIETFIQRRNMNYQGAVYRCDSCPYETKKKGALRDHAVTHKPLSEINWYTCSKCNYQTKHKRSIIRHIDTVHKSDKKDCRILVKRINGTNSVCIGETDFSLAIDEGFIEIKEEPLQSFPESVAGHKRHQDQLEPSHPKRCKANEETVEVKKEPGDDVEKDVIAVKAEEDKDSSEKDNTDGVWSHSSQKNHKQHDDSSH